MSAAATMAEPANDLRQVEHADGVYFDLDEESYFQDNALGSSDMRRLSYGPEDFWFASRFNPDRPLEQKNHAQVVGTAVHCFVLYGPEKFAARYARAAFNGNTKAGIEEGKIFAAAGKIRLRSDDYDRICMSGTMIRANPYLAEAFSGGRNEVSVFWTRDGIRRRARFDCLKPRAVVDLKSIRNSRSIDFVEACRRAIAEWNYPAQAAHYLEAREALRGFIRDGKVYGDHDYAWLRMVAQTEAAFVICFWQAENAPLTWACSLSPGNPILDVGRAYLERAEENFRRFRDRFGMNEPWVEAHPVEELDMSELPGWYGR